MPNHRVTVYLPSEVVDVLNAERSYITLSAYIANLLHVYVDEIKACDRNENNAV